MKVAAMLCFSALVAAVASGAVTSGPGLDMTLTRDEAGQPTYQTWCVGNCDTDVQTVTQPGTTFVGGGVDPDEVFEWHITNTNKGDFLILSAADYDDEYNDWVFEMSKAMGLQLNSVRTIEMQNRLASYDEDLLNWIRHAEGIFFEGGDQSRYINWWVGTDIQSILQGKLADTTVGGTSAGLAILGNWIYSAEHQTALSKYALQNPYYPAMTFAPAFLHINFLESVITDTHFSERDRMGRMLAFVARVAQDYNTQDYNNNNNNPGGTKAAVPVVRGIGVDEPAGMIINATTGAARAVGSGNVYICASPQPLSPSASSFVCLDKTPLTFFNISCTRLSADNRDTFSFATWTGQGDTVNIIEYLDNIQDGVFLVDQATPTDPYGNKV